jgi:hypothetical protein
MEFSKEDLSIIAGALRKATDQDVTEGFEKEQKSLGSIFKNPDENATIVREMEYKRLLQRIEDEMSKMK